MGRYSVALGKIGPTCNPNNPCSGKYGKCLDLKLTNECNGNCPFCIEAKGYSPQNTASAEKLAETINAQDIQTVLILGGEPLLYPDIVKLLSLIRKDLNIVLTTNGSLLTPDLASAMTPYIKGMNISIHHSTSAKHEELTKIKFNSETLYKSIHAFGANKIRINCNLVKGTWILALRPRPCAEWCEDSGSPNSGLQNFKIVQHYMLMPEISLLASEAFLQILLKMDAKSLLRTNPLITWKFSSESPAV